MTPERLSTAVPVNVTIRMSGSTDVSTAKQDERQVVCYAEANGTLAELRTALTADKNIGADDFFVFNDTVVEKSSESMTTWNSVLEHRAQHETVIISGISPEAPPHHTTEEPTTPPSALATAHIIDDLGHIEYPEGIKGPEAELNIHAKQGRFRYDREFLLQFMNVCKARPADLPPLESLGILRIDRMYQPICQLSRPKNLPKMSSPRTQTRVVKVPTEDDKRLTEDVERAVNPLLEALTEEQFDSISEQAILWANKSEEESDARTLYQVVELVFAKATDGRSPPGIYARLCRKLLEEISPNIQDDGLEAPDGSHVSGGRLVRRYLMLQCREYFERTSDSSSSKGITVEATPTATEDRVAGASGAAIVNEVRRDAQKITRQGLATAKFATELFALQLVGERTVHQYVQRFLANAAAPKSDDHSIDGLCELLTAVGPAMDTPRARAHMESYFSRMKMLVTDPRLGPRAQALLQEVIALRERKWVPPDQMAESVLT